MSSMTARLQRVLMRRPPAACSDWRRYGWRSQPDPAGLAQEHEALAALLEEAGAEVVVSEATTLDAIYVFDPVLLRAGRAIMLRPGKEARREEPEQLAGELAHVGVAVDARLEEPATAEGGDLAWLDERTLLAGRSYRTNAAGIDALGSLLEIDVLALDLPSLHGPGACLHLLSLFSPLDTDLVVAYPPLLPVRLVQLFEDRGFEVVPVPDDEFDTMGPNALALAPRVAVCPERNRETRRRLERAGVDVLVYRDDELAKGDGGPTCLTLPLLRG
jgi:N-dimethylarginine dimethylaminohydrolase